MYLQSDFYNCLNNIRLIRNLIFSYINEEIFLPIYLDLGIINKELLWRKKWLNQLQKDQESNYIKKQVEENENVIKTNESKLNRIINWYKQFKVTKALDNYEIAKILINEREEYYK